MAHDPQVFIDTTVAEMHDLAAAYKQKGWRFAALSSSAIEDTGEIELLYSFSDHLQFENLRLVVRADEPVPSVSDIFFNALVFENEAHDLFGATITDIAIDFHGKFYIVREPVPMNPGLPNAMSNFTVAYRDSQSQAASEETAAPANDVAEPGAPATPAAGPGAPADAAAPAPADPSEKEEGGN
ncbi:MAG: NADH-quinone oxidoreductase subunit C [Coriobacteriia bacterium]|nr:NADH-quinone oxidoreductase subunit C [Coriobacteriia bacterium]